MSGESENNDLDREVESSMRMFERSKVGQAASLVPVRPSRVLWVLDGSPQDNAGQSASVYFREHFNVETLVLDARETRSDDAQKLDLAPDRAKSVSGARPITSDQEDSYDQILSALDNHDVDLVVVPCPFGRPFEKVGSDSAGTVIDVLLNRSSKPLLVIRREDQRLEQCVSNISVIVGSECDMEARAASWAFGLASDKATITLNLVIEKEHYENIRSIVEAMEPGKQLGPEQFSEAITKTHQSLHESMAKTAGERAVTYHLLPQAGEIAPPNPLQESKSIVLVMPLEVDDRFGQGFVQDRIRRSPHPVLIVPGHVPS